MLAKFSINYSVKHLITISSGVMLSYFCLTINLILVYIYRITSSIFQNKRRASVNGCNLLLVTISVKCSQQGLDWIFAIKWKVWLFYFTHDLLKPVPVTITFVILLLSIKLVDFAKNIIPQLTVFLFHLEPKFSVALFRQELLL